ncbi:ADP-dependent glucokinase-like [Sarcoptes scabiei]|nr:ADP-dependent glucokinase-like [Sarcoptes scabiei]
MILFLLLFSLSLSHSYSSCLPSGRIFEKISFASSKQNFSEFNPSSPNGYSFDLEQNLSTLRMRQKLSNRWITSNTEDGESPSIKIVSSDKLFFFCHNFFCPQ